MHPRKLIRRNSPIHGNGVFAGRSFPAGQRLVQYRGRLRTHEETDALDQGDAESGHTFLFTLNDRYVVDGAVDGNIARWINHSCEPNCEPVLEEAADGNPANDRIYIETVRPIRAGEELTYNYGIRLEERHTPRLKAIWACRCGSPRCRRTMLESKRTRAER